jgi:beta-phosphoglucomutase-like phosphatase (HAD superfamily)
VEDLKEGKPSPDPSRSTLMKLGLTESEALVVENASLGIKAANNAGIGCIVTLNNTPLKISDFHGLISDESIFPDTTQPAHS